MRMLIEPDSTKTSAPIAPWLRADARPMIATGRARHLAVADSDELSHDSGPCDDLMIEAARELARRFGSESPEAALAERFRTLRDMWRRDTASFSSTTRRVTHPAYQQIIGMGADVAPLLLRELATDPDHWFWALKAITGADPVRAEDRGRVKTMAEAWLRWGRAQRLVR